MSLYLKQMSIVNIKHISKLCENNEFVCFKLGLRIIFFKSSKQFKTININITGQFSAFHIFSYN